jgi:hypothetical protein
MQALLRKRLLAPGDNKFSSTEVLQIYEMYDYDKKCWLYFWFWGLPLFAIIGVACTYSWWWLFLIPSAFIIMGVADLCYDIFSASFRRLPEDERLVRIKAFYTMRAEEKVEEEKSKLRRTILFVAAAVIGVIALATNPNEPSLREMYLTIGRAKAGAAGSAQIDTALETHSRSYYLFMIGSARLPTYDREDTFLGVFGHWYPLPSDDAKPK